VLPISEEIQLRRSTKTRHAHSSRWRSGGNHLSHIGHAANRRIGNMNEPVIFPESDALCAMLALPVEDAS
jgi:hypothetical protein